MTVDVLIVGSGAGGAPLALALSRAGFEVLVVERGRRYAREEFLHDETFMAERQEFFVPSVERDPHIVIDHGGRASPVRSSLGWTASCVGGGTAHMGANLYRFHPDDFRVATRCGGFEAIADWPYDYDTLEPYYGRAEWELGVSGTGGVNPFEGPRSCSYPMPPLPAHPLAAAFDAACARLGLTPFPTPRGINSRPFGDRPACELCDFCAGYGCPTGARGGTHESLLPRAERTGRCTVCSDAMVREVLVDARGRAAGCVYIAADGIEHRIAARVVCVCCSAVESARLLLVSRSRSHPDGLANGTGLVGRHLQFHVGSTGRARFDADRRPDLHVASPLPFLGRSVMDYYFAPPEVSALSKGGLMRFDLMPRHPVSTARRLARADGDRTAWGIPLVERLAGYFARCREVEFEVFQDYVPNAGTWMELDPDCIDRFALPVARIHLDESPHHGAVGRWLRDRGMEILAEMGADALTPGAFGYTSGVMAHGTCRMGVSPHDSVLDPFCQAHEVPGLFVVDGSFMPTSGGAPTTLTIVANSFRTADYIVDRARTMEL